MSKGCLDCISLATVKAPRPGAGTDRPALSLSQEKVKLMHIMNIRWTHVDVDVKARMPRIGAPNSRAVFALITIWTPVP